MMEGLLDTAIRAGLILLAIAFVLAFFRVRNGPSLADRVVALDTIAATIVGAAILFALQSGLAVFVDVALAMALVTFLGTIALARAIDDGDASQ